MFTDAEKVRSTTPDDLFLFIRKSNKVKLRLMYSSSIQTTAKKCYPNTGLQTTGLSERKL